MAWPYCQKAAGMTRLENATVAGRSKSRRRSFRSHLASAADEARRIIRSAEFSCASIPLPGLLGVRNDAQDLQALKLDRIIGCSKQGCSDRQTGICGAPEKCPSGGDIALRQMSLAYGQLTALPTSLSPPANCPERNTPSRRIVAMVQTMFRIALQGLTARGKFVFANQSGTCSPCRRRL